MLLHRNLNTAAHQREGPSTLHRFSHSYGDFSPLEKIISLPDKQFWWSCHEIRCKNISRISNSLSLPSRTLFLHDFRTETLFQAEWMAIKGGLPSQKRGCKCTVTGEIHLMRYPGTRSSTQDCCLTITKSQQNPLPWDNWDKKKKGKIIPPICPYSFSREGIFRKR